MTGQPIAAIRIQEAILDELQRQAEDGKPGPYVDAGQGARDVIVDGHVDVQAIAIAVANLVNDR